MDDELMRELIRGQKEQTELLRKNLGRLRFSMRALLFLMTVTACGLGYVAYVQRSNNTPPATRTFTVQSKALLLNMGTNTSARTTAEPVW